MVDWKIALFSFVNETVQIYTAEYVNAFIFERIKAFMNLNDYCYYNWHTNKPMSTRTSSSSSPIVIIFLILTFPLWIGIVCGFFGIIVGIIGAVVGIFGAVIGA